MPTPPIRIKLFSVLKERVGEPELLVEARDGLTVREALDALADRHPAIRDHRRFIRAAVNRVYAPESATLSPGDEIALITPVSGG